MPAGARFFIGMDEQCSKFKLIFILICLIEIIFLRWSCLFVETEQEQLVAIPAEPGIPISIHFIHSVQKTPVEENLIINEKNNGFDLKSTVYQSFGVGLPFLESDGFFRQEGDYFILDNMDRHFQVVDLRTGVGTKLTLDVADKHLELYRYFSPGTKIRLEIKPWYHRFYSLFL